MEAVAEFFRHNDTGWFSVDWYVGRRCNFDCTYCPSYLHDNYSKHVTYDNMKKFVDIITEKHGTNVYWSLSGGEPTVNPDFMKICHYIKHEVGCKHISLTTNGSRKYEYFEKLFENLDNITLSLHLEYVEKRVDEYIEKATKLYHWAEEQTAKGNEKSIITRFMVWPKHFDTIMKMEEAFKKANVRNIEYRVIRYPHGNNERKENGELTYSNDKEFEKLKELQDKLYSNEEKEIIKTRFSKENKKKLKFLYKENDKIIEKHYHYNQLNFERMNNFKGWMCYGGAKAIKIDPSGDIYIGNCHVGGSYGNLYKPETIKLPSDPVVCPKNRCTDNTDLKVPKIKDKSYLHLVKNLVKEHRDDKR